VNLGERETGAPTAATVAQVKATVRETLHAARTRRADEQRLAAGEALVRWATALPAADLVAGFLGVGTEPPTLPLLRALRERGATVLLPVVRPQARLDWAALPADEAELTAGPLGLREPPPPYLGEGTLARAGLVLVPALAVDRSGRRLGRGGGFYDRALAALPAHVVRVAVVFDDELLDELPAERHDQPVSAVLTPGGLYRLGG
jgi:5-formyltetrahydrofolate cyclo-ligase